MTEPLKASVQAFWNAHPCGDIYAEGADLHEQLDAQARRRYEIEPFIRDFAKFDDGSGRDVLEIGVGMGADHLEWAKSRPRSLTGVDLTERAIELTRARFLAYGATSTLRCADAEKLPFPDESFDLVYSWGVLHHSPNTPAAINEVRRVLRPGGIARVMVYHRKSIVGAVLWLRYGLIRGKGLGWVYANYLESPGTKAYSVKEAEALFSHFSSVVVTTCLTPGDLLVGGAGQRHHGWSLTLARRLWPRALVQRFLSGFGLNLMVDARK